MRSGDEVLLAHAAASEGAAASGRAPAGGSSLPPWVQQIWTYRVEALSLLITLGALVVAYRVRPSVLFDDAAITGRYAERLATGHGWTYNDGDRTNGASAPLHTMVVAMLHVLGLGTVTALRLVSMAAFAVTAGLVTFVAGRMGGLSASFVGGVATVSALVMRQVGLSGMESTLAAALGVAVIVALVEEREVLAGILLGLAILNKLDAGFLALAVGASYFAVHRRPPWRMAAISAVVVAPWFMFATVYFGSPVPYSMTQKIDGMVDNPQWQHSTAWVWNSFDDAQAKPLVVLFLMGAALIPWMAKRSRAKGTALAVAVLWPLAHGLAFSLVSLGDAYPWYLVVLYPPMIVAGAVGATTVPRLAVSKLLEGRSPVRAGARAPGRMAAVPVGGVVGGLAALVVLGSVLPAGAWVKATVFEVRNGHSVQEYEAFEVQRREAGRFVAMAGDPGDVVEACWGWIAYEAIDMTVKETCPINTRDPVGEPRWSVIVTYPGTELPNVPEGTLLRASFISEVGGGGRVDVIEMGPDVIEEISRRGSATRNPD